jgi:hypothetical protein
VAHDTRKLFRTAVLLAAVVVVVAGVPPVADAQKKGGTIRVGTWESLRRWTLTGRRPASRRP